MTIDPWWKTGVFYELDPLTFQDSNGDGFGDLNGITARLDYLEKLGVDAVVLSPFQLPPTEDKASKKTALDTAYGTDEDFDQLEREASLRKIRVVVDLPLSGRRTIDSTLTVARFWLSRGVGGLRLTAEADDPGMGSLTASDREDRVRLLRKLCAGYVGNRVLVWDVPGVEPPSGADSPHRKVDHTLADASGWDSQVLRRFLAGGLVGAEELAVSDAVDRVRSGQRLGSGDVGIERTIAAALFLGRESPMLYFGQELGMAANGATPTPMAWGGGAAGFTSGTPWVEMGPNAGVANVASEEADPASLLNWYRKLGVLVHENGALHGGTVTMVETGYQDVVAWVRRGSTGKEPPLLVVCNVSARAVLISLTEALKQVSGRANGGVQALAMSFGGGAVVKAGGLSLPGYGVYVGTVLQPGLEDAPEPVMSHKRGR